jgi:hypothetical protein
MYLLSSTFKVAHHKLNKGSSLCIEEDFVLVLVFFSCIFKDEKRTQFGFKNSGI